MSFYTYLSSKDSRHIRPTNTFNSFVVELPKEYFFRNLSDWSVALVEISFENVVSLSHGVVLLSDVAQHSVIQGELRPVLRIISSDDELGGSLFQSYAIALSKHRVSQINIELRDLDLEPLKLENWEPQDPTREIVLRCMLHFQKNH